MNISESVVDYLADNGYGVFGTDIFIGGVPLDAPNKCMWVVAGGGSNIGKNGTGEKQKNYLVSIFYRNTDAKDVLDTLESLESLVNSATCIDLDGYNVIEVEGTQFPIDQDLDNEDRSVGLIQVTITVYNN